MESSRMNFLKNGVLSLPPGFRFDPTDEELVVQYLKRKVHSFPLPASIIPDLHVDVSTTDPWGLPGDWQQERYFFSTPQVKYPKIGNGSNRATVSGYWKATGLDKQIVSRCNNNQVVGMKKTLVFYRGKPPTASPTDWIMHEYRVIANPTQATKNWLLSRIFLKKRASTGNKKTKPVFHDLNKSPAASSSSGSSVITHDDDVSSSSCDEHKDSSSSNRKKPKLL